MGIIQTLSTFALGQIAGENSSGLVQVLGDRFGDSSQRLLQAIRRANERAWKALEIALAGESLWHRLDRGEDRAFRQQVRQFINSIPLPILTGRGEFRRECLRDLQDAQRHGLLLGPIVAEELADAAGAFARFVDMAAVTKAEREALESLADEVEQAGHRSLAWLLQQHAQPGESLVVVGVRFFFRREVETDAELARRISFGQLEALTSHQQEAFQRLDLALTQYGDRLGEALDGLTDVVIDLRDDVRALRGEMAEVLAQVQSNVPLATPVLLEKSVCSAHPDPRVEALLLPLLRRFQPQEDLHLAPDIPPKKLAQACRVCQVPTKEVIFALIDATVTGTARSALLLGCVGVWYHNEHGSKVPGAGHIPYPDLASRRIVRESWSEVCLDRGEFFNRSGSQIQAERLVELLRAVQRALQFS
jgi:hypothetical protein